MQARFTVDVHADADTLEEYVVGRLPESVSEPLEEHLLICPRCQAAIAEIDEYVLLMKHAIANLESKKVGVGPLELGWAFSRWGRVGIGVTVTALVLVWMLFRSSKPETETNSVQLVALRGDEMASVAPTRNGPLDLVIDVSDLPGPSAFRLDVVDAAGRRQWSGSAVPSAGKLMVRMPNGLSRGIHWVRLSSAEGELLREFGLRAD